MVTHTPRPTHAVEDVAAPIKAPPARITLIPPVATLIAALATARSNDFMATM